MTAPNMVLSFFSVSKNLLFLTNDEIHYLAPSDEGAVSEAD